MECILENIVRTQIDTDSMQFGFIPGQSTTDAIFILCQMQRTSISNQKTVFCLRKPRKAILLGTTVNFVVVNEKVGSGKKGHLDLESHVWWC